ncbi:alternate-type signal peptide domain-containing protein [Aeromicrobium stalagmiti]|uniref:alternate-type signal peptide domain-containing protein n=1 Tax=Aeromicrobium stalagmiti TaxID=2738988 RepID=UPI00156A336F|nr:alternate-type signal peptide domain-containing protein [Aeromicrobium stalagmiti]NRQ50539.1 alternate-type signal peptide domain-containing protein [Aeromicrobium stalagmiti]
MKKSTKGALAAAAAGTLLLGGAGSLAFWNATVTLEGGDINGGKLTLTLDECSDFEYEDGTAYDQAIVPGDLLTKVCTYTIGASGDNLAATPSVDDGDGSTGTLNPFVTVDADFDVAGAPLGGAGQITSDNEGDTLTATITVDFPFGAAVDNASNDSKTLTLDDYVVTLTQDVN